MKSPLQSSCPDSPDDLVVLDAEFSANQINDLFFPHRSFANVGKQRAYFTTHSLPLHGNTFVILTRSHPYVEINYNTHFRKNMLNAGQIAMYVTTERFYFTGNRLFHLLYLARSSLVSVIYITASYIPFVSR